MSECSRGIKGQIGRLQRSERGTGRLSAAPRKKPIPAGTGVGFAPEPEDPDATKSTDDGTGGTGIASPLTELPGTREYYATREIVSSDGLFVLEWQPVKTLECADVNGDPAVINLMDPA